MRVFLFSALGILAGVHGGYIYKDVASPPERLTSSVHIEVPTGGKVVSEDGRTTFWEVHGEVGSGVLNDSTAIDRVQYPFAAKFHWEGDQGIVSCLQFAETSGTWRRLAEFEAPRGDESNPATNCQPSDGVDCENWLEPNTLKAMCASLLVQRKSLEGGHH